MSMLQKIDTYKYNRTTLWKEMNPQDIFEYKMKWYPGVPVYIHSDMEWRSKAWCKKNLERQQWSLITYTDVYEHTLIFETAEYADLFKHWLVSNIKDNLTS